MAPRKIYIKDLILPVNSVDSILPSKRNSIIISIIAIPIKNNTNFFRCDFIFMEFLIEIIVSIITNKV